MLVRICVLKNRSYWLNLITGFDVRRNLSEMEEAMLIDAPRQHHISFMALEYHVRSATDQVWEVDGWDSWPCSIFVPIVRVALCRVPTTQSAAVLLTCFFLDWRTSFAPYWSPGPLPLDSIRKTHFENRIYPTEAYHELHVEKGRSPDAIRREIPFPCCLEAWDKREISLDPFRTSKNRLCSANIFIFITLQAPSSIRSNTPTLPL